MEAQQNDACQNKVTSQNANSLLQSGTGIILLFFAQLKIVKQYFLLVALYETYGTSANYCGAGSLQNTHNQLPTL